MNGQRLGNLSLRLDAAYCVVLGFIVVLASTQIAQTIALPTPIVVVTGVVVAAWGLWVEWMRRHLERRLALRVVMIANIVATMAIALVSLVAATFFSILVIISIAVDVALFAGSQAAALRIMRSRTA